MIKYSGSYEKMKKAFSFLIQAYHFDLVRDEETNYNVVLEYKKGDTKVYLNYDYMDNWFAFNLIKGIDTSVFSVSPNNKKISDLVQVFDPSKDYKFFQPNDDGFEDALKKNAEALKKYGDKVLKGEEWYW